MPSLKYRPFSSCIILSFLILSQSKSSHWDLMKFTLEINTMSILGWFQPVSMALLLIIIPSRLGSSWPSTLTPALPIIIEKLSRYWYQSSSDNQCRCTKLYFNIFQHYSILAASVEILPQILLLGRAETRTPAGTWTDPNYDISNKNRRHRAPVLCPMANLRWYLTRNVSEDQLEY